MIQLRATMYNAANRLTSAGDPSNCHVIQEIELVLTSRAMVSQMVRDIYQPPCSAVQFVKNRTIKTMIKTSQNVCTNVRSSSSNIYNALCLKCR